MIIIIRALPQWGKDDGDYDPPTSRDETPDEKEKGKMEAKKSPRKKLKKERLKKEKKEKTREKREGAMLLSFYHTCASK